MAIVTNLILEQYAELIREVDNVCHQARELSRRLHAELAIRARNDLQFLSLGNAERRHGTQDRRTGDRRSQDPNMADRRGVVTPEPTPI
jgi:hypothetical protein